VTPLSTTTQTFEALPLDVASRFVTGIFWVLVVGVWAGSGILLTGGESGVGLLMSAVAVFLAVLALALRQLQPMGYRLGADGLTVVRRRGTSRVTGTLHGARSRPFESSDLRLLGSGGVYGYLGRFRLTGGDGRARSYVTDGRHAVLVSLGDQQVLVSPREEAAFISAAGGTDA
jgi:hypothetical protein